jgi:apolipoprotein N-acyltransferase
VRAANNGISGVVDAYGRVIDAFALDAVGALDVAVPRQRLLAPTRRPDLAGLGIVVLLAAWAAAGLRGAGRAH